MFDESWTKSVTLTVRKVDGHWEHVLGGGMPVKDGAVGELTIPISSVTDKRLVEQLNAVGIVRVLPPGTKLLVAMSRHSKGINEEFSNTKKIPSHFVPPGCGYVVPIEIGPIPSVRDSKEGMVDGENHQQDLLPIDNKNGLYIRQTGLNKTELLCNCVILPKDFDSQSVKSLNHAFTLLSERYETHRLSHTGNVYTNVFYPESDGNYYPVGHLRNREIINTELKIINAVWQSLAEQLGFMPVSITAKNTGNKR